MDYDRDASIIDLDAKYRHVMPATDRRFNTLPLSSGIFLDAHFTAPWSIRARVGPEDCGQFVPAPGSIIAFHYVYAGELVLRAGDGLLITATAGEVIILPRNEVHILGSDGELEPIDPDELIQPGEQGGLANICYGGGGNSTRLICGFLGCKRNYDPVLSLMPSAIKLTLSDAISANWFDSSFKLAAREMIFHEHSASQNLAKLTELLFLDALQQYVLSAPPDQTLWSDAAADPRVLSALSLLQTRVQQHWTTEMLAREVGMSRSAFASKFTELTGLPPMRYLSVHRLQVASRRLREGAESLARIAFDIGYESEAAFNRAFRKEYGLPPAAWRKHQETLDTH